MSTPVTAPESTAGSAPGGAPATLDHLLAPLPPETFFDEVWERHHYHLQRQDGAYYGGLLTLDDLEAIIGRSGIFKPPEHDLRMVKTVDGRFETMGVRTEFSTTIDDVHRAYTQGYTISVTSVERRWGPVAALCRSLAARFQCPVGANLYLTPPNAQGFGPHYDTHDVIVLQLAGRKTWRLHGVGRELPLPAPTTERPVPPELLKAPIEECLLETGDLLYLPRGHVHAPLTSDVSSLHLTLGVHVVPWADLLCEAVRQVAEGDPRLRQALAPDLLTDGATQAAAGERLRDLLRHVCDAAESEAVVARLAKRFLEATPPLLEGHFAALDRLDRIDPETRVRRRDDLFCLVGIEGDRATIRFAGNLVNGPAFLASTLRWVAQTESFTVGELPGQLTDQAKVVLVRRLVREGLLTIEPPPAGAA